MFCSKCGSRINEGSNFCNNCGDKTGTIIEAQTEDTSNNNLGNSDIPLSLMQCEMLRIGGKQIEFFNEEGNRIISVFRNGKKSFTGSQNLEYSANDQYSSSDIFMNSKTTAYLQHTAYDKNNELLATASCNTGLKRIVKTIITIKTKDNDVLVFEEKVGFLKGIIKILAPGYILGIFFGERTGNMIIKKNNEIIGEITASRGKTRNSYITKNCNTLREKVDIRLILLGMTVKSCCVK